MADTADTQEIITISQKAAQHMRKLIENENGFTEESGVRIEMVPGGCSGMKYDFQFAEKPAESDTILERHQLRMFIPSAWEHFLTGTTIDYVESLSGSGFQIDNPNIKRSCGCGKSVS